MKYQPTFDQVACIDLGLGALDGILIDLIVSAPVWAKKITHDGEDYYYLAQEKIIAEIPSVFNSKPAVTRAIKRLGNLVKVATIGRSNYYSIDARLSESWGKKDKGEKYQELLDELLRKRNSSESGTVPEAEVNSSESGTIPPKIVPKVEPIKQPINKPTSNPSTIGRFTKPSVDDCKNYLTEIGVATEHIDGHSERFISHYDSVDWVVGAGGNPMKDWQASLRGWVMRSKDFKSTHHLPANETPRQRAERKAAEIRSQL